MTNLDDKLREILNDFGNSVKDQSSWMALGGEYEPKNDPIAQIQAAIAELVDKCLPNKRTNMTAIRKRLDPYNYAHKEGWNQALKEIRNNLKAKGII